MQRRLEQRAEPAVDAGEVALAVADPAEHDLEPAAAEGRAAGRREGDRRGPAPPVGRLVDRAAGEDLRGEVAGGAHDEPGAREPDVVGDVGDAEVDEDRVAVEEQDVARLEVAVHDADRVDGLERADEALAEPQQRRAAERPLRGDDLVERGAGDVARDEVGALAVDVGVDDRGDALVADAAEGVDLALEPGPGVRVVGDVRAQHLDGHGAALRVESQVDDAHPPSPRRCSSR